MREKWTGNRTHPIDWYTLNNPETSWLRERMECAWCIVSGLIEL